MGSLCLSLRCRLLFFVCRCAVGFLLFFRFVVVLHLGCWFLFVCLCGVWCVGLISAVARGDGLPGVGKSFQIRGFMPKRRSGGDERVQKNHGGPAFRKKKGVRVACFNGDDRNVLCCFYLEAESRAIEASARRFFELEEEDQQRRQTFPWDAWKRTLIKAMERSSFDVSSFVRAQRSHPAWLMLLLLRSPLFLDCWCVHSLHLDDSIVCPVPLRSRGRISKAKRGELDKIHALLLLLRPLLQSGSLRSVLETAARSAALALSPFGKGVQRQRQEVVEESWKRV